MKTNYSLWGQELIGLTQGGNKEQGRKMQRLVKSSSASRVKDIKDYLLIAFNVYSKSKPIHFLSTSTEQIKTSKQDQDSLQQDIRDDEKRIPLY